MSLMFGPVPSSLCLFSIFPLLDRSPHRAHWNLNHAPCAPDWRHHL